MRFLGVEVMSYADYGILIRCYVDQATTVVAVNPNRLNACLLIQENRCVTLQQNKM
jgi:hypothetical protein